MCAGIVVSPHVSGILNPRSYVARNDELSAERLESTTLDFTRLVLSLQVCLAGVHLPPRYLRKEWRSMAIMLGPAMVMMWLLSSLLIWAIAAAQGPSQEKATRMPFLHVLAVGACITPTDPVLSNTIIKGRWADMHVLARIAHLISAESGANDGLGYPFLFLALYLIKYLGTRRAGGAPSDHWAAGG
jgi:NhaP-type Na+/H+ or K+/H+ antiporter